ncbi:expressed unknown protein [Seminavis robusta]|uniref:Uncharacterized protein n=1 Tax=Seminavis robusta TaxID=568900 RepID=A0A9N8HD04_9STRA|nr:expressed unknown protein [Seminavis robusta]|eukprot:Sro404_g135850.1 n/a (206) ;mRNA; r:11241-11858
MLKRVTKVALTAAKAGLEDPKVAVYYSHSPTEDTIGALENMRVQALSGCNGQQAIPVTRKEEEIEETKRMFRGALEDVEGEAKSDMLLRMGNALKQMTAEQTNASALECGEAGLWVLVHGLSCQTGQPLNGKLGLVFKDGLVNGKVALELEGVEEFYLLQPSNLQQLPFSEQQLALISTLDKAEQWKYVRGRFILGEDARRFLAS